jgi:hypothetical protein
MRMLPPYYFFKPAIIIIISKKVTPDVLSALMSIKKEVPLTHYAGFVQGGCAEKPPDGQITCVFSHTAVQPLLKKYSA